MVTAPALPGLVTEGDALEEARQMAKDAIRGYLESLHVTLGRLLTHRVLSMVETIQSNPKDRLPEAQLSSEEDTMNGNRTLTELNPAEQRDPARSSFLGMALILVLCLTVTGGCQQADPLAKAFNAMGGRAALLEFRGFSYESEGDRFEPGQGLNPTADPIKASSFTLALLYDVDNDALSLDWQRQIFDPLRGEIAYRDILNGDVGYQTGNDSVFNPPGVTSDRALTSERIAAVRREFRLLNPLLYLRAAAESKDVATVKADVELGGRVHHVIEVADVVEPVELFVDAATGRVSKLGTVQNDHIWGDVATEVSYGGWSTPPGGRLMFPHQVELSIAGKTIRTARRGNVVVNPDFPANAFALPEEPRTQTDPAAAERGDLTSQYLTRWHALAARGESRLSVSHGQ